uniref:Zmp:0000000760 n=1 Tax=Gadus morhua TaxID=8049 RepID=A0A8C5B749_GADMO
MLVFVVFVGVLAAIHCQKLPSFDMLEEFRVSESRGVRRVNGSDPEAVAYRVNPSIHLQRTMSDVYPDGLPSDYSVIATFKVAPDTARKSWNLWQVSDPEGREQVGLRFHGDSRSLDFFYAGPGGAQKLRSFTRGVDKLFDGEWHKLALSVRGGRVRLLVDCGEVAVERVGERRAVIRQGFTSIVKRAVGDRSVAVDLQQMDVSCDPEQAYSEGCCELSSVCGGHAEMGITAGRPPCKCMNGQPGVQGRPGSKGHRGLPGNSGDPGRGGNWGIMGNTGDYGHNGEPGLKGESGIRGEEGLRGLRGRVGDRGPKGLKGLQGAGGFKVETPNLSRNAFASEQGIVGDPGQTGTAGEKGKPVCTVIVLQQHSNPPSYKGSAAKPGRPGFIGPPGPVGHVGFSGKPGTKGSLIRAFTPSLSVEGPLTPVGDKGQQGPPGGRGRRGPGGEAGRSGPVGVKGVRGEGGPDGFQGPPGPTVSNRVCTCVQPGVDGSEGELGQPGFYGDVGDAGRKGSSGDRGEQGDKGSKGHGLPGHVGDQGTKGQRGRPGRVFDGQPGKPGERGHVGRPGVTGHLGLRGVPGICLTSGCDAAVLPPTTATTTATPTPPRGRQAPQRPRGRS